MTIRDLIQYNIKRKHLLFDGASGKYGFYFQKHGTEFPRLTIKKYVNEWKYTVELRDPLTDAVDALVQSVSDSSSISAGMLWGKSFGPVTSPHIENNFNTFNYGNSLK